MPSLEHSTRPRHTDAIDLTDDDITSFITMWRDEFGETLARDTAVSEAKRLIDFFLTLAEEHLESAGRLDGENGRVAS